MRSRPGGPGNLFIIIPSRDPTVGKNSHLQSFCSTKKLKLIGWGKINCHTLGLVRISQKVKLSLLKNSGRETSLGLRQTGPFHTCEGGKARHQPEGNKDLTESAYRSLAFSPSAEHVCIGEPGVRSQHHYKIRGEVWEGGRSLSPNPCGFLPPVVVVLHGTLSLELSGKERVVNSGSLHVCRPLHFCHTARSPGTELPQGFMSTPTTIFQFWVIALLASIIYILEAPYFSMFKPLLFPPPLPLSFFLSHMHTWHVSVTSTQLSYLHNYTTGINTNISWLLGALVANFLNIITQIFKRIFFLTSTLVSPDISPWTLPHIYSFSWLVAALDLLITNVKVQGNMEEWT